MKKKLIFIPLLILTLILSLAMAGCADGEIVITPEMEEAIQEYLVDLKGEPGEPGEPGGAGSVGPQGEQGPVGSRGSIGAKGSTGSTGADGEQGEQGEQGERGRSGGGSTGPQGIPGPNYFTVTLTTKNSASAIKTVGTTAQLQTTGTVGSGDEARIVITPTVPMTLGQLMSISWWENLTTGYPPHVDVILDVDGDGVYTNSVVDDALVFEYAYNGPASNSQLTPPTAYGALTGKWYSVFKDNTAGAPIINGSCNAWATSGPSGGTGIIMYTLDQWKSGQTYTTNATKTVDCNTRILSFEIEVDNWIVLTDALVDCITINGTLILVP